MDGNFVLIDMGGIGMEIDPDETRPNGLRKIKGQGDEFIVLPCPGLAYPGGIPASVEEIGCSPCIRLKTAAPVVKIGGQLSALAVRGADAVFRERGLPL